jgi:hypothetical protein
MVATKMIGRTFPREAAPYTRVMSIEGRPALELYLLRIGRNTEALCEQLTLLRTALLERSNLLAEIDLRPPAE